MAAPNDEHDQELQQACDELRQGTFINLHGRVRPNVLATRSLVRIAGGIMMKRLLVLTLPLLLVSSLSASPREFTQKP